MQQGSTISFAQTNPVVSIARILPIVYQMLPTLQSLRIRRAAQKALFGSAETQPDTTPLPSLLLPNVGN